jgi:hypothetical protein
VSVHVVLARPWSRITAAVAVAVAAGITAWWFAARGGGHSDAVDHGSSSADVSAPELRTLVQALGRPVYWAGPKRGFTYEFTETSDRRIYVRYLPAGVAAGSLHAYLTVASYPVAHAFAVTRAAAGRPGMVRLPVSGGVGFYAKARPTNAYIAFPGSNAQIEVYDPSGKAVTQLVAGGRIQPVVGAAAAQPVVQTRELRTSTAALRTLSRGLSEPIYWLGELPGDTLALTHAPDGRVYLRYLPHGVAPGSPDNYPAVGTYPVADAFEKTLAAAKAPGAVRIRLPHGAVAFYAQRRPTNVYVAFPGVNEEVEVYDPNAAAAHRLIAAGKLVPVS